MTYQSSFAPRDHLDQPADFGSEADATWRLATNLDEAVRLSCAIDQHIQALAVNRLLRRGRHSMADLAAVLGERPEMLADKLRGRAPAPEGDLVVWSWLTATARVHPPLRQLTMVTEGNEPRDLLPELGVPARVAAKQRSVAESAIPTDVEDGDG